ncbi:hypothetical protein PVMG_01653 [Plasmodium vivax Mauritania I]|uniref:Uncharacterized protein n=1 Tax=Plasmodium vivax Mauritania I TaxID=1035515 RepID=A0A0J9T5M4_PLAVI|nr:hypothetical protein PVMG_01653 [Plasmodium vivax Mauritania I]
MKLDRKKDFKKKLVTCFSLLQVSDPIKVIVDETFIHLCIVHKIPIKEELAKLVNRQLMLMTTKCISTCAKKTHNEETAYGIRKITHYKCNHNGDHVRNSLSMFLKKMKVERNSPFSVNNFFENEVSVTHNFDSVCNKKSFMGSLRTNSFFGSSDFASFLNFRRNFWSVKYLFFLRR